MNTQASTALDNHKGTKTSDHRNNRDRTVNFAASNSRVTNSKPVAATRKQREPTLDIRLFPIKELVDVQPTIELQTKLFELSKSTLLLLFANDNKINGVDKFATDEDFIPHSLRFNPTLNYPSGLKTDPDTLTEEATWKDDILQ